jgi:hypothetical protein
MLILLANQSAAGALMTEVATWSTTDDSNVDIFPEGMYLGQVNNAGRAMQGALARQFTGAGTKYVAPVGAVGAPTYSFAGSLTSGWYLPAADQPALTAGGTEVARGISGKLILGATSSLGDYKLQITHPGATFGAAFRLTDKLGTQTFIKFLDDTSVVCGSISLDGPTVDYNTTSDERMKDVVGSLIAGDIIDALNPIRFKWKNSDLPVRGGFLAQQVAKVVPEAVKPGDDGAEIETPWMIDVSALIPVVVAELKALRKRVASLEVRADQNPDTLPGERII